MPHNLKITEDLLGSPVELALHQAELDSFQRGPAGWRVRVMGQLADHPTVLRRVMQKLDDRSIEQIIADEMDLALKQQEQAQRWAPAVRAAGETVPNAHAPAVTPDTVWSGDFETLVELFRVSLYRVTTDAAYVSGARAHTCQRGFLHTVVQHARRNGRTHVEP